MTNLELVEYAKKCLELGDNSVYVYGTYGKTLTTDLCDNKHKQYPNINTTYRTDRYKKLCDGKHIGFDCVGLIKSFYWGGYPNPKYNSNSDVSANGMYNKAKVKGNINTIDKSRVGLLVQMDGHIGIYIGNDEVIECTISTTYAKQSHGLGGVCKTKLSDRKWSHWCECPYITYENKPQPAPSKNFLPPRGYITFGDSGDNVDALSKFMRKTFPAYTPAKALGSYYGKYIMNSIKEFQKRCKQDGLYHDAVDGNVGPKTYACLQHFGFKY